ncbi:MAG: type II secretion system F family protein [Anaerolineae bacterium]|nr:type II secretion system F family protein [Anaerolineae bacterium]NUQ02704.1 type II secretion system F family protein [Anaerolineae bacterium]
MDQSLIVLAVIVVGTIVFVGLIYVGLREDRGRDPLQERLAQFEDKEIPQSLEEIEMSLSFRDRVLLPMMKALARLSTRFTPQKQLEETRRQIELAGMSMDPATFFAVRIMVTIAFALGGFFVFFVGSRSTPPATALLYTIGLTALGYVFPLMWIQSKIKRRQENIWKALPDALDLLVICVEAGLGFDMAMGKVFEKWDNELAIAFGRVLREIQLGKLRRDSLRDMANRMDVPDVTAFVAAIIQADQLGVSMAKILRVQADQMRVKRRQRAQEKAHQAPVKMIFPMVFLIFPSIWIVLLGPSIIILLNSAEVGAVF